MQRRARREGFCDRDRGLVSLPAAEDDERTCRLSQIPRRPAMLPRALAQSDPLDRSDAGCAAWTWTRTGAGLGGSPPGPAAADLAEREPTPAESPEPLADYVARRIAQSASEGCDRTTKSAWSGRRAR